MYSLMGLLFIHFYQFFNFAYNFAKQFDAWDEMELLDKQSVQMYSSIVEKQMSFRRKLNAKFSEIYLSPERK